MGYFLALCQVNSVKNQVFQSARLSIDYKENETKDSRGPMINIAMVQEEKKKTIRFSSDSHMEIFRSTCLTWSC